MAVKTYDKSLNIQLTKNFKLREFRCGLGSGCNCKTTLVDDKLLEYLQQVSDYFGADVIITSAYRCPDYNRRIGGATGSYHSRGMAADFIVEGVAPRIVAAYCESSGILGIGLYETAADGYFVHIDTRTYKSFWYGQAQSARTSFGGTAVCAGYGKDEKQFTTQPQAPADVDPGNTYTVRSGDTLAKIAAKYSGVTYQQIAALNGLEAPYVIYVGQKLAVPSQSANTEQKCGIVTADIPNVRSGPGVTYPVISGLRRGTSCVIVQQQDGWGKLKDGGWVCLDYVGEECAVVG